MNSFGSASSVTPTDVVESTIFWINSGSFLDLLIDVTLGGSPWGNGRSIKNLERDDRIQVSFIVGSVPNTHPKIRRLIPNVWTARWVELHY